MCGLFVFVTKRNKDERERICSKILSRMISRGPDGQGLYSSGNYTLSHNRLAIIDEAGGAQPMVSSNKRFCIVFNGEIVNYKELIPDLRKLGFKQQTNSDTEVLLQCYEAYGRDLLEKIKGMFAFVIYDSLNQEIFIARDPVGICPLFYYLSDDTFIIGSDARAFYDQSLLKFEANHDRFDEFLVFGQIYGRSTLHKNIYEFPVSSYATYSIRNGLNIKQYYESKKFDSSLTHFDIEYLLETQLLNVAKDWSQSESGLSSFLSGGLDSTTISTIISNIGKKIDLFTFYAKDDPHAEEIHLATKIANKLPQNFQKIELQSENILNDLLWLHSKYSDPLHDSNSLTTFNLCKAIKERSNNKVVITGEGADELFGGYDRHHMIASIYSESHKSIDIAWGLNRIAVERLRYFTKPRDFNETERFMFASRLKASDSLGKVLEFDQFAFMPAYLQRQNQIGLLFSLELRPPFLDERLISLANQIPSNLKYSAQAKESFQYKKFILRKVAQKFIPTEVCWHRKKYQFSYPVSHYFDIGNEFHCLFTELLNSNSNLSNYYDIQGIKRLLNEHKSTNTNTDHSNTLFRLMSLELWLTNLKINP